uniref:Nuclear receptor n=1 Tax=Pristionchus pacificus TaxID=54126 RepID=A0A2A6C4R4_PRIPA|eukprot:PDM73129.1 nuclear receptor [Pristionchus pacificus]
MRVETGREKEKSDRQKNHFEMGSKRRFIATMECVICAGPLTYRYMEVNSCRACAVFYKRTIASKSLVKCKSGDENCLQVNPTCRLCRFTKIEDLLKKAADNSTLMIPQATSEKEVETSTFISHESHTRFRIKNRAQMQDPKSACRLCRFTRMNEILTNASGDTEMKLTDDVGGKKASDIETSTFINHESFYECEPSTSQTPLLDKLRKGYSLMCLIRHGGELGTRTKVEEAMEIKSGNLILVPATYATFPMHGKTCKEAMKAFANHTFEDFRELDEESKEFIVRTSHGVMNSLDATYRSMHHFPGNDEIRTPGYTTYVRAKEIERFFADCPDDVDTVKIAGQVSSSNLAFIKIVKDGDFSEIRKSLETSVSVARRYYRRIKPTDYEFLALLGLALWNDEISNLNEKVLKIAMANRALVMRELHSYYAQRGISNYAKNASRLHEDFELYRLMNLFKDYLDKNS